MTSIRFLVPGVLTYLAYPAYVSVVLACALVAVSDSFLTFVLEQLSAVRELSHRKMFGGVGLYAGESFFAVLDNDTLFFKVDETTSAKYRRRRMPPFMPIPGKAPMTGYYQVPPSILEDADAAAEWAGEAIAVALRQAQGKARKKPARRKRGQ